MLTELLPLTLTFSRLSDEDPDMMESPDVDDVDEDEDDEDGDYTGGNSDADDDDGALEE